MSVYVTNGSLEEKIVEKFESANNMFWPTPEIMENHSVEYHYSHPDKKLIDLANGTVGTISDCYILYAIGHMGVCTAEAINLFLETIKRTAPNLSIASSDSLRDRLRFLKQTGYLFIYRYEINRGNSVDRVTLYTLTESAYSLVVQHLQKPKKLIPNSSFQAKPFDEIMGWAAGAYVGASIANRCSCFSEYLERTFRTKQLGYFFYPVELKVKKPQGAYYIAVLTSYLSFHPDMHTKADYAEWCAYKVNVIKNYLACRTQKGKAQVILTVRDKKDLEEMGSIISNISAMEDYLEDIFFTSEGVFRERIVDEKCFLKLKKEGSYSSEHTFVCAKPDFL